MTDSQIIEKAIAEVEDKTLGVTEQFLEIHQLIYENGKPKIARIDRENVEGIAVVYFPVKDQKFFLAVYLDTIPEVKIRWVHTENYNCVYFRAYSDRFSLEQLSQMTVLKPTKGRTKGDLKRPVGGTGLRWKDSTIFFEPNPEPDKFEDKLKKLLDYLDQDKAGVTRLINEASGYIQVAIEFHNGNSMLGGPHIDLALIKRMADLNLEIDFDLYVGGNKFT